MHNTAREFIIRSSTWKRLERTLDEENFEVPIALLAGLVMRVKSGPEDLRLLHKYSSIHNGYTLVEDAMHFAYIVDGKTRYKPQYVELMDTLDQAMTTMTEAFPQDFRSQCAWPTWEPMESGAIYPYDGFLCYVAQGGLSTYLDTKLSEMSLQIPMAQKVLTRYSQPARSGIPMLCFSQKQYLPINYHYGDPNVARVLLRYGADPKLVWEGFLHHGYHCFGPASRDIYRYSRAQVGMQVKDRRRWIDVLKLFLEHGANPITIVELRFGRR
ncbi:hypothetical protein FSHL1_000142 [Fusarium sambucinum]